MRQYLRRVNGKDDLVLPDAKNHKSQYDDLIVRKDYSSTRFTSSNFP